MAIEGSLESVDIENIVQLLNLNRSTGLLHIIDNNLKGVIYYQDGEIVNASVEGLEGEAAVYLMLAKDKGNFNFELAEHGTKRLISRPIHDLVLETARRKDTINKIRATITHDNIVYLPLVDVRIPAVRKEFNEFELQLISQLDGQTAIKSILEKQKESAFETMYIIYELEKRGVLKRVNIYKILEAQLFKKLFGKAQEVVLPQEVYDSWVDQSMTYADCTVIEMRTQSNTFGQVPMITKSGIDPNQIQIPKQIMEQFEISVGDRVLIKPIVNI